MKIEFTLMVYLNALLVALYLLWNWAEYSVLNGLNVYFINAYYPWYIQLSYTVEQAPGLLQRDVTEPNFGLALVFIALFVNLYLAYRLQRSKETKLNTSQNAPAS